MKIVKKQEVLLHKNSNYCKAREYPLGDEDINGAVIELRGRYPDKGRVVNNECKEMAYVIEGSGKVVVENKKYELNEGDLILIDAKEKYYWEGSLKMFVPCVPAWNVKQHEEVD